jgi:hypothetical protein
MRVPRVQFTVQRLMALVLATAVNIAFVRLVAAEWGAREALILLTCLCGITAPLAFSRPGRRRAIAAGLAYGGGVYLLLSLGFAARPDMSDLPTTPLLDRLYDPLCNPERGSCIPPALSREDYFRIGQCMMGLIAAGAGGLAGLVLDWAARRVLPRSWGRVPPARDVNPER